MSLSDPFALSERALLTVVFVSGVTLLVFWQRRQRSGDDKTNLLLSALARLEAAIDGVVAGQAASDDGWKLPGRWRWSRRSSCWTNPSPESTRSP